MLKPFSIIVFFVFIHVGLIAQRLVLIEQFTNSGCPPCAASTPKVMQYVDSNLTQVVAVAYHTSFPYNDSMYFENPAESNARVSFNNVSGVPYSIVDGNYYQNSSSAFLSVMQTTVNNRLAIAPKYKIMAITNTISGNTLNTKMVFESLTSNNVNDSLRAMVVVVEKKVLKSAYTASPGNNTETFYNYVMRKMLPNSVGSYLPNRNLSGQDTLNFNWSLLHIKSINEIRIVTFVQNITTKEVYQTAIFDPAITNSIDKSENNLLNFSVYPNPTENVLMIEISKSLKNDFLQITDVLGKIVIRFQVSGRECLWVNTKNLPSGLYILTYTRDNEKISKKIIIQK